MKKLLASLAFSVVSLAAMGQTTFRNPIIPGYHPDPSITRVGDYYYLINSSFEYFPGVPMFKSKDLINWQQIGDVLTRESQIPLKGASSWLGIYAPTIRYNDGTWYMITTNVGNGGNFMVTASQPEGPWSEPIWLKQQGIDPSLFFEDGKCYMCSNPEDAIWVCEIDPKTGQQLSESKKVWQGDGGRYPEGPHIYKKDGYYYLLISEGGTELAHSLTIARSKNIYGPYESNPANPLLTNCSRLGQTKQIQGTGHGDLLQAKDGSWWMVFLAYRNFGGSYHHLGRETYLAPVEWKEGEWPVVNNGMPADTLMTANSSFLGKDTSRFSMDVHGIDPAAPGWLYIQNPITSNYKFDKSSVTLSPHGTLDKNERPTFLGRRQSAAKMTVETEIALPKGGAKNMDCKAGLTVYQINDGRFDLYVDKDGVHVGGRIKSLEVNNNGTDRDLPANAKKVALRISSDGNMYNFFCSTDGGDWQELSRQNCSLVSTEVVGGFTGVILGMFTEAESTGKAVKFTRFDYTEK